MDSKEEFKNLSNKGSYLKLILICTFEIMYVN